MCLTPHVIYVPKFASILFGKSTNDVVFQTFNNVHVQYIFDRRAPQEKKKSQSRHGALSFPFTGTAKVTSLERSWKTLVELNYS